MILVTVLVPASRLLGPGLKTRLIPPFIVCGVIPLVLMVVNRLLSRPKPNRLVMVPSVCAECGAETLQLCPCRLPVSTL